MKEEKKKTQERQSHCFIPWNNSWDVHLLSFFWLIKFILKQFSKYHYESQEFIYFFARNQMTSCNTILWNLLIILPFGDRDIVSRAVEIQLHQIQITS